MSLWIRDSDHQQNTRFWTAVHSFTGVRVNILENMCHGQTLEIRTANGARLKHDGGRLVRFMRPEARALRVLFHACDVQKPILALGLSCKTEVLK